MGREVFLPPIFLRCCCCSSFPGGTSFFTLFFPPGTNPHHRYYSFGCGEGCFLCFTLKFSSTSHRCSAQLSSRIRLASWAFSSTQNRNTLRRCQGIWPGEKKPSPSHTQTPEDRRRKKDTRDFHAARSRTKMEFRRRRMCCGRLWGDLRRRMTTALADTARAEPDKKTHRQNRRPSRTIITNNKNRAHGHGFFLHCEFSFFLQFPSSSSSS